MTLVSEHTTITPLTDVSIRSARILQPILLPGLSFFNALPSLHLHLLVRSNPPTLALWFSTSFAILYLTSSLLLVISCTSTSVSQSLRQTECAVGTASGPSIGISKGAWGAFVAFNFLSTVMYLCHAGMAFYVKRVMKQKMESGILEVEDPEKVEARKQKARDLWVKATTAQGL